MKRLTQAHEDAINYLYGGGDETIECWSAQWVTTRYAHVCCSVHHSDEPKGTREIPAGTRVIVERAKVDGQFGTCYTCNDCLKLVLKELKS